MNKCQNTVLFIGKQDDWHVNRALQFCLDNFTSVTHSLGQWGEPFPDHLYTGQWDYIISYLSRWIVPQSLLLNTRIAAINFHPGSPDYPGVGCINFALYEEAREFGATCHHMNRKVDTGTIIAVKRFPILATDTVASLIARTHDHQLALFYDVITLIASGAPLPVCAENWTRQPFTRKELNELSTISPKMTHAEIQKRIRATYYGDWKPSMQIAGFLFELKTD